MIMRLGCDIEMLSCVSVKTDCWSAMHTTCAAMNMIQLNRDHCQHLNVPFLLQEAGVLRTAGKQTPLQLSALLPLSLEHQA